MHRHMAGKKAILLTRPSLVASADAALLAKRGHKVLLAPMLEILFQPLPSGWEEIYLGAQAVVASSANALRALAVQSPILPRDLAGKVFFAIGEATAREAKAAGFLQVVAGSGRREAWLEKIAAQCSPQQGTILLLSGAHLAQPFEDALPLRDFALRRVVLYRARKLLQLPPASLLAWREGQIEAILLFSRRASETLAKLIETKNLSVGGITAYCLTPACRPPIADCGFRAIIIAPKPSRESLFRLLPPL